MRIKSISFLSIAAIILLLVSVTTYGVAKKKGKKLESSEIKGQTVMLKDIVISTKANTLSKAEVKAFVDDTLPKLLGLFEKTLKRQFEAGLEYSDYDVDGKNGQPGMVVKENGGIVKATWNNTKDAPYTASVIIKLKSLKGMIMVSGIVKKKDPNEPGKPFKKWVPFAYMKR